MKRTNIMLSEDQHRKLKLYAKKEGRTLSMILVLFIVPPIYV